MKTILALFFLLALPALAQTPEKPIFVRVKILQVGDGGARVEIGSFPENVDALVADQRAKGFNVKSEDFWKPWGEAWLRADFSGKADGDFVNARVVKDGIYQYTTVTGAPRTLHAWKAVR